MEIPHSPSDLNSSWLTSALRHRHTIETGTVSEFRYSPLEEGKGFYGQIVRLQLTYSPPDSNGPRIMLAKFSSGNPEMRQRPDIKAAYEREVRFYQEAAKENRIPVPICYYADIDIKSGWHILLLEDLTPACSGSRIKGCSQFEARIAVHHIARFHAHWWENPKLDNFKWLANEQLIPGEPELAYFRSQLWPDFLRKIGKPLPKEIMEIGEFLGEHLSRIKQHLLKKPQTLLHSDYHLENMMFSTAEDRKFFVIDWQLVERGRGIWDVAYFLSQNLTPEDRQAIEINLIHDYLNILYDNGVQGYSFDEAIYDYRISLLRRFGNLITTIAAMPFTREQIMMHIDILLPRVISTILDHDCRSLLDSISQIF